MFANLSQLKSEFGVSGGTGGGIDIDMGSMMTLLGSEGPAAGPVHAFEILNAAKCSANHGMMQALSTTNMMNECALAPLRILASLTKALSAIVGAVLPALPLAEIGQLIGALTGGIQSLGCINLGIARIHVQIQGQAQSSAGAITSGVGSWVSLNTDLFDSAARVKAMVNGKRPLKDILAEKAKNFAMNTEAWRTAVGIRDMVKRFVTDTRGLVKKLDEKEKQAMNTLDAILKTAHSLKNLVCSILAMLRAFLSILQSVSITIGIKGTIVAEIVQVLQAILSAVAAFFAALQDLLNFLTSLCVEAEVISVKMFTNTLSSVKEKFRELGYAAMAMSGGV